MKFNLFISCVISLFISNCFFNNLFSIPHPEYHVYCDFTGPGKWQECAGGSIECRGKSYRHRRDPITFSFHRNRSSWEDFLNDKSTFDECFLEDVYRYLQRSNTNFVYSNISSINWKNKGDLRVPFIEGSWFYQGYRETGFFRLYVFPTRDKKSSYYLCIRIQSFNKSPVHEKWYDRIFSFIRKSSITRINR